MFKLIIFDLDGTIWDHEDISSLKLPFHKISDNIIIDSNGVIVKLHPHVHEVLNELYNMNICLTIASWNNWDHAYNALKAFNLIKYFKYIAIENHPRKHELIAKIINWYKESFSEIDFSEILYIDDRTIHLNDIYSNIGPIKFIQMWIDIKSYHELLNLIKQEQ